MEKPKRPRLNPLLLLALMATVAAVIFAPGASQDPDTVVLPSRSTRARVPPPEAPSGQAQAGQAAPEGTQADGGRPPRFDVDARIVNIFAAPARPASRAAAAVAPPAPRMPAFEYRYMGQVVDQGEQSLFFTRAGRPYVVKPGDTLEGNFLLESVSGNAAVFVYVPLSMRTTIVLGEGK